MTYFASGFLVGLLATLFIMRSSMRHGHLSADHDLSGPQKFHSRPVPRIGGVAVFIAVLAGACLAQLNGQKDSLAVWLLIVSSLPTFVFGLPKT